MNSTPLLWARSILSPKGKKASDPRATFVFWAIQLKLIIIESVIITTFFGYVGMVLGVAANEYMDATLGHETIDTGLFKATMFLNPTVGLDVCFEATMVMVIAGTIAGLIPAFKASRIRPIEALRAD